MLSRLLLAIVLVTAAVPVPASADPLGAGCPSGALLSSIECRVGSLLAWAQSSGPPPAIAKKIKKPLLQANKGVMTVNRLLGKRKYKPARSKLGKADRNLSKVANTLGASPSVRTRAIPPTATVAEAAAFCRNIQTDVETVRTTLVTIGGPVVFGEICCVRVCIPTETDPTPCAIVDAIPCTTPACLLTAACASNCVVPTPLGTTCAQLLGDVCQGSVTCDAFATTCLAP